MPEITGFSYPNDIHVHWSLMIVMYPYLTGFVAGAFIVTSLYHLFGREEFKPIARLAMATSFCFLAVATFPLLLHLGHPERGINVIITPNFSSAMAGFGLLYSWYLVVLSLEVWFVYRQHIVETARSSRGLKRLAYAVLALGTYDTSPEAIAIDHRAIRLLAGIGLPSACMLHGYVGFIFGAIKANPWWSTPLMPVIFLLSAAVSGIALLVLLFQVTSAVRRTAVDQGALRALARWLWFFMILTVTLELLEIVVLAYEKSEAWHIIGPLLTTRLAFSFISVQMIVGALIPFILLMIVVVLDAYLHHRVRNTLTAVASLLLLVQVFSMRWNVVIGGQLLSKSLRGLRSGYTPHLFGREGALMAIALVALPFLLLVVYNRVLPLFPKAPPAPQPEQHHADPAGTALASP
jgi:Ni/Fe-hydrogenase subunit HybB-like protein